MRRFFAERIENGVAFFNIDETVHMKRVLRMKPGDMLTVPDGKDEWICELFEQGGSLYGRLIERQKCAAEPKKQITLYMAYSKADKLELCVQKAVELGISGVCPFISSRCVKIPDDKSALKANERMKRIAHEAVKQCGRASKISIFMPTSFPDFINGIKAEDVCIFAYEQSEASLKSALLKCSNAQKIGLIIGPEGGFADSEAKMIESAGAHTVSLGNRVLRSETAAIALMAIASYELEN